MTLSRGMVPNRAGQLVLEKQHTFPTSLPHSWVDLFPVGYQLPEWYPGEFICVAGIIETVLALN